jgi:single-strand DNA-binding protein
MSNKSVNKVILLGSVGHDPEVKVTASGIPVGRFSLATNERFKDKSGKFQDRTEWHNIVVWRRLAEIVGEFVSKGSQLYIEGKLQTTSWEDRQSAGKKYRTEVVADDLVLLGSREKGSGARPPRSDQTGKPKPTHLARAGTGEMSDDEVPF